MKKMRNFLTLAAAAALTGILLTGCSTEADETTIAKAETTTQTESAADAEKTSEGDVFPAKSLQKLLTALLLQVKRSLL